jgi:hypothetical protein
MKKCSCGGKLIIGRQYIDIYEERPIIQMSTVCEKCGNDRPYQPPKRGEKGRFIPCPRTPRTGGGLEERNDD